MCIEPRTRPEECRPGFVQAVVIEPSEILDDRELKLGARAPDAIGDQFGLERVHEALGEGVVERVADRADRLQHVVAIEQLREIQTGVLGGFKGSLQHLDGDELRWASRSGVGLIGRGERRCVRRVVHRWPGVSTGSGSGLRSPLVCGAIGRARSPACLRRLASGGSVRVKGCHRSAGRRCRGGISRSPTGTCQPRGGRGLCARTLKAYGSSLRASLYLDLWP